MEDIESMKRLIFRQLGPTMRRVALMVSRGIVRRSADDHGTQQLQVSLLGDGDGDEETADDVEHMQPFGVSFVPPAGSETVTLSVGGNRDHLVALGVTSRAHRPRGADEGEGGLYTLTWWKVFCDADGNVYLGSDATEATEQVAVASKVEAELDAIRNAIADAGTAANDGGATFKANIVAKWVPPLGQLRGDVGSSKAWVVE